MSESCQPCPIVFGAMDEAQKRKLIDDAVKASAERDRLRVEADRVRARAIKAALDGGVTGQELADALGVNRVTVYRFLGEY